MWTKTFWKATAERAVSTAAQSAILVFGADQVNALVADWQLVGGFAAGGAVLSVLKSLAAQKITGDGPGLTDAETLKDNGAALGYGSGV
jgi:hypothetical protein